MSAWVTILGVVLGLEGFRVSLLAPAASANQRSVGVVVVAGVAAALALAAEAVLDAGDVSPETFRIGAGLIVAAVGVVRLMVGAGRPYVEVSARTRGLVPVAFPVAFTPELVAWSTSRGVDALAATLTGLAIAAVVGAITTRVDLTGSRARLGDAWVRLTAGGLTVLGVVLVIDGIRAV
jgi:small neutral amino acid transporter SnatA (MarC family)